MLNAISNMAGPVGAIEVTVAVWERSEGISSTRCGTKIGITGFKGGGWGVDDCPVTLIDYK